MLKTYEFLEKFDLFTLDGTLMTFQKPYFQDHKRNGGVYFRSYF